MQTLKITLFVLLRLVFFWTATSDCALADMGPHPEIRIFVSLNGEPTTQKAIICSDAAFGGPPYSCGMPLEDMDCRVFDISGEQWIWFQDDWPKKFVVFYPLGTVDEKSFYELGKEQPCFPKGRTTIENKKIPFEKFSGSFSGRVIPTFSSLHFALESGGRLQITPADIRELAISMSAYNRAREYEGSPEFALFMDWRFFRDMAWALLCTFLIELAVAHQFLKRDFSFPELRRALMILNVLTLPALWYGLLFQLVPQIGRCSPILLGEVLVFLTEAFLLRYLLGKRLGAVRAFVVSATMNAASYFLPLFLQGWIWSWKWTIVVGVGEFLPSWFKTALYVLFL